MTNQTADPGPERIDVLAALLGFDASRTDITDLWRHADGRPYTDDEAALITSATMQEWELADALRDGPSRTPRRSRHGRSSRKGRTWRRCSSARLRRGSRRARSYLQTARNRDQ